MSVPNSTMNNPVSHRATSIVVSEVSSRRLTSGELTINNKTYALICDEHGNLRQEFLNPIMFSPNTRASLRYKMWRFGFKRKRTLDIQSLPLSTRGSQSEVIQDGIRIMFNWQDDLVVPASPPPSATDQSARSEALVPTTRGILDDCPKFRILVIGKSGVGKSSLINTAFGIEEAHAEHFKPGQAQIEKELTSPANQRFILHDSVGFEPGESGNYETVKRFISDRQIGSSKGQIHVIWFCIQTPLTNGRLEIAAENFFRSKQKMMGAIPLIVVFTKFDACVDTMMVQVSQSSSGNFVQQIVKDARSRAELHVREQCSAITELTGEQNMLPYASVSTRSDYRSFVADLINLTDRLVGASNVPEAQVVNQMAQRIDPRLKIRGSISIGKKRYWKALSASPDFKGHTIWDCLSVVHTDIVDVWNFNDPASHLYTKEFKELVVKLVHDMETPGAPGSSNNDSFALDLLKTAISSIAAAVHDPITAIVVCISASVAAVLWLHKLYQNVKNVQQILMAYIVDLTHIMETLFILTAPDHHKLTRRAIKLAVKIYHESDMMAHVHARIREYRDVAGRDAALEKIESLIKPKEGSGTWHVEDYYENLDKWGLNLDQEEDW